MTSLHTKSNSENTAPDNTEGDIGAAKAALQKEIEGLQALSSSIDSTFEKAIQTIQNMKDKDRGRLIVAGIGKSGHVARKIAATMASTGTPAYYVHPGEASHGDLGMVNKHDVVLMLSNSGENNELSDLIHHTRRFGIPLITITSNSEGTMAKHADINLIMPRVPEACPNGLAPTTSSTMMMALGDALAVALLKRSGLTSEQFKVLHPGGKLGQRLQKVSDLMIKFEDLPIVDDKATMDQALIEMSAKNLGAVVVVDGNRKLRGIITDGDLKRHMSPDLMQKKVTGIMTTGPRTILSSALAATALDMMTKNPKQYLTSLIVMDEKSQFVGMIRLQDCLNAGLA